MAFAELPLPPGHRSDAAGEVWRVPYQQIAESAAAWSVRHRIGPAAADRVKVGLVLVDVQNTFCIPGFELYVGGRSGTAAVDDNRRLCGFVYRNLANITRIVATLDTHRAMQIFHAIFLVDADGRHPEPYTQVTADDVAGGRWRFNPAVGDALAVGAEEGQHHLRHYTDQLRKSGKYTLTVWPYHAMLGGIGHALVSAVEQAIFFHTIARCSQPDLEVKGSHPLTEHYSVLGPEVATSSEGETLVGRSDRLFRLLEEFDALVFAGQAKSHCVAWSIADLLGQVQARNRDLARKIVLLEDCTSPVVVPGVVDFTADADAAFARFREAGAHLARSTEPMASWPSLAAAQCKDPFG
jgi:nicotinamidase-related amidase